jgi:hypothetical protein
VEAVTPSPGLTATLSPETGERAAGEGDGCRRLKLSNTYLEPEETREGVYAVRLLAGRLLLVHKAVEYKNGQEAESRQSRH